MRTLKPWPLPRQPARRDQLLSPTVSDQMIRSRLARGHLVRLRSGVYLAADSWPDDPQDRHRLLVRAELLTHPGSVISHESAAVIWDLPQIRQAWHLYPPSITLPGGSGSRTPAQPARYRTARLSPHHVTTDPQGDPVTTVARTAVDLARGQPLPASLVLFDAAARITCGTLVSSPRRADYANPRLARAARDALLAAVDGVGAADLRAAIALTDPRRESPIESLSAGHFHLAGLPAPDCQRALQTTQGTFFADFYWPEHRLVGEADGMVKYRDPAEIAREKMREQALRDAGYRFVRWLGREIHLEPGAVVARVARQLGG